MMRFGCIATLSILSLVSHARGQAETRSERYAWKNVKIVAGGFITGIVFSPKERGLAYARTDIGGAYRFDSKEMKWIPLTDWVGPRNGNWMGIESIAPDPTDAEKVYLAMGTYARGPAAIARSSDRGKTFQVTEVPFAMGGNENGRGIGERLAVDPSDPRVLYFGSRRNGLWVSTDSAATWKQVEAFPIHPAPGTQTAGAANSAGGITWVVFDPRPDQPAHQPTRNVFAGVASDAAATLYESHDGGQSWRAVAGAPPAGANMPHHAALDSRNHALYLTINNGPGPNDITAGSVWKYQIDENAWSNITPLAGRSGGYSGITLDGQHPGALVVSSVDQWSLPDDLFRSTDEGKSWKRVASTAQLDPALSPYLYWGQRTPRFGWWMAALAMDPFDSNHMVYGTGATIWASHDFGGIDSATAATHWSVEAEGIEETAVLALVSPPQGPHLISGVGDIGGFTHEDFDVSPASGMHNNPIFTNTTSLDFAEQRPNIIVRTGTANRGGGTAAISEDSGKSWRPVALPTVGAEAGQRDSNQGGYLVVSADGSALLTTNARGTFMSKDKGATWIESSGLYANARPIADRVVAGTFYAIDMANKKVYVSHDGGASFSARDCPSLPQVATPGRGLANARIRVKASFLKEGDLFLVAAGKVYRSRDGGGAFSPVAQNISVGNLALGAPAPANVHRDEPTLFVAGTLDDVFGLFRSDDLGKSWIRINDEAHQFGPAPTVIAADPRVWGRLYIGMNGRGILYGDPTAR